MADEDQSSLSEAVVERRLENLLTNVHRWVSFAEAKNSAILALSGAAIVGMFQLSSVIPADNNCVTIWFWVTVGQILAALCVSVISFLPRMKIFGEPVRETVDTTDVNIVFFEDLARLRSDTILALLNYDKKLDPPPRYLTDLARQLSTISQICKRKYRLFYLGAYLLLGAVMTPIVIPLIIVARRYELA